MRASSAPPSDPPRFLSRGRGLEVALQFAHGRLVQREQVEVEGGIGDIEVACFLDQVHDLCGREYCECDVSGDLSPLLFLSSFSYFRKETK